MKVLKAFNSKLIIPVAAFALGAVFLYVGLTKFGFWAGHDGPTPGFVPIIIAVLLMITSVMAFFASLKQENAVIPLPDLLVGISGVAIYALTYLFGLLPTLAIYCAGWLRVVEKTPWKTTLLVTASVMAVVIAVFVLWLGVRFPVGFFYETIFG